MEKHFPCNNAPRSDILRGDVAHNDSPRSDTQRSDIPRSDTQHNNIAETGAGTHQSFEQTNPCDAHMPDAHTTGTYVTHIIAETPADDAGFEPGCLLHSVDGKAIRDMIDWLWLTSEDVIEVCYTDLDGDTATLTLEREPGEDWGFKFDGVVFDGIKQCCNTCTFCFMRQLPAHARPSLTVRDDDFRLSFLAGTFITLTNVTFQDEQRIIRQHISPLRVSLHAIDPDVRASMMGKHAQRGLEVFKRLLAGGIKFHAQIVLVPNQNDKDVLYRTLTWAYEQANIIDVCIVPLGFTKYQSRFTQSFNNPERAAEVLELIEPFQRRAKSQRKSLWVFAADEFYRNAYGENLLYNLPSTEDYGEFAMFEDGVGIMRTFVNDWHDAVQKGLVSRAAAALDRACCEVCYIAGCAMREVLEPLIEHSALDPFFKPLFVRNDFFGGNVDVTGLLCGCDIAQAIQNYRLEHMPLTSRKILFACPGVVFNDDGVTLDDMTREDIERRAGACLSVVSCTIFDYLNRIITEV